MTQDGRGQPVVVAGAEAVPSAPTQDRFWFRRKNPKRNAAYWERKAVREKERRRRQREQGVSYYAAYRRRKRYGLTELAYAELVVKQGARCAICRGSFPKLTVDHDHTTGTVRGLLCYYCNLGLMAVDRMPGWTAAAERYINDAR